MPMKLVDRESTMDISRGMDGQRWRLLASRGPASRFPANRLALHVGLLRLVLAPDSLLEIGRTERAEPLAETLSWMTSAVPAPFSQAACSGEAQGQGHDPRDHENSGERHTISKGKEWSYGS